MGIGITYRLKGVREHPALSRSGDAVITLPAVGINEAVIACSAVSPFSRSSVNG